MDNVILATLSAFVGIILILSVSMAYYIIARLRELHASMNSRLDELLVATRALARAEGFKAGREDHLSEIRTAGRRLDREHE